MFGRKKFKADGVYLGRPYQVDKDGRVDVDFGNRIQTFADVDGMVDRLDEMESRRNMGPLLDDEPTTLEKKPSKGCGCLLVFLFLAFAIVALSNSNNETKRINSQSSYTTPNSPRSVNEPVYSVPSSSLSSVAEIINVQFGRVCHARIEGFFSSTLRLDWTAETNKLNAITVLAAIGKAKETMYNKGIRYLKFPNDAGTYNIIDWKTGEKSLDSERARYYFP